MTATMAALKKMVGLGAIALALIFSSLAYSAETRYVTSNKAALLNAPSFKAEQVLKLKKGTKLSIISKQGKWLEASVDNKTQGWVSKFLTKTTPPSNRATVLTGEESNQLKDVRRRTSALTTAAAARGLAYHSASSDKTNTSNKQAVTYMESFNFSDELLNTFSAPLKTGAN